MDSPSPNKFLRDASRPILIQRAIPSQADDPVSNVEHPVGPPVYRASLEAPGLSRTTSTTGCDPISIILDESN